MTVDELIIELQAIVKVHPEAGKANIWYYGKHRISTIGYDRRHKPARIWLRE